MKTGLKVFLWWLLDCLLSRHIKAHKSTRKQTNANKSTHKHLRAGAYSRLLFSSTTAVYSRQRFAPQLLFPLRCHQRRGDAGERPSDGIQRWPGCRNGPRTLEISLGVFSMRFEDVQLPVVPAICVYLDKATLLSSSLHVKVSNVMELRQETAGLFFSG